MGLKSGSEACLGSQRGIESREASKKRKNLERQASLGLGRSRRISLVENPPKRKSPELEGEKKDEIKEGFLVRVGEPVNHHQDNVYKN